MDLKSLLRTAKQRKQQQQQQQQEQEQQQRHAADHNNEDHSQDMHTQAVLPLSSPPSLSLDSHVVGVLPTCYYLSEWCSVADEQTLMSCCRSAPQQKWVQVKGRQLQCFGMMPTQSASASTSVVSELPDWLNSVIDRLVSADLFPLPARPHAPYPRPNHVLLNHYQPGQGIMAHKVRQQSRATHLNRLSDESLLMRNMYICVCFYVCANMLPFHRMVQPIIL